MPDRLLLDSNVLIYAVDRADPRKHMLAVAVVLDARSTGTGRVSFQVVHEWVNFLLRKSAKPLTPADVGRLYETLVQPLIRVESSRSLLETALSIHATEKLSWWDSLIVSAAIEGECARLLTEDLQHGQVIRGVRIENPFL
jgi:predicted nucleic acid-binding protein